MTRKLTAIASLGALLLATPAFASTVNVLWYSGGVNDGDGDYKTNVAELAAQELNPLFNTTGVNNTWNVTFWDGGAMPVGAYNVLVTASPEGGWSSYPDFSALTSSVTSASFGDRVMLTGQDADWHYTNSPGPSNFNGPAGFLIDAINWAGSGKGMGGVFLGNAGLGMFSGFTETGGSSNTVTIPAAYSSFPINTNLTSAGLSNWSTSAHDEFGSVDSTLWTSINTAGAGGAAVTIVSAATASAPLTAPDATTSALLVVLAVGMLACVRRPVSQA